MKWPRPSDTRGLATQYNMVSGRMRALVFPQRRGA